MQVEASHGPIEQLEVQAIAVAVFKDEQPSDGFLKKLFVVLNPVGFKLWVDTSKRVFYSSYYC